MKTRGFIQYDASDREMVALYIWQEICASRYPWLFGVCHEDVMRRLVGANVIRDLKSDPSSRREEVTIEISTAIPTGGTGDPSQTQAPSVDSPLES